MLAHDSAQNDPSLRWGVLGVARVFERRMVPAFRGAHGSRLVAIGSRNPERAEAAARKHGIDRAHGSYAELLEDPDVDAVFIPLPNDQHREWSIRALEAGKHVLCDKPAALTAADARAMAAAAAAAGRRLMEGFMFRHHPQHDRLRTIVAKGEIGEVVEIRGVCAYVRDAHTRSDIRWFPEHGGGAFLDVGVYPLNAARLYFGAEPIAVTAVAREDAVAGVDLHTTALLEFPDGRTATISSGFDQLFASRIEIVGTRGTVTAGRAFQVGEGGVTLQIRAADDTECTETFRHIDQYAREVEHFSACARDPARPLWPGEDGVAQALVVEAVRRSAAERRRVLLAEVRDEGPGA